MLGRTSLKREKWWFKRVWKFPVPSGYCQLFTYWQEWSSHRLKTEVVMSKVSINLTVKKSLRKSTAQVTKPTAFAFQRALLETQATLWALYLFVIRLQSSNRLQFSSYHTKYVYVLPIKICSTGWSLQMTKYKANKYCSKAHIICCPIDNKYCMVKVFYLFLKDMYVTKNY